MARMEKGPYTAEDYWSLPGERRAELIDGRLWDIACPNRKHQEILTELGARLRSFVAEHEGSCKVYVAPFAVNVLGDDSTFVEPDVSVIRDRDKLSDRGCEGAPDFIVEIVSLSHPGMDYVRKLALYREAGVREYWICDPMKERVLAYRFDSEELVALYPFSASVSSAVLPGFAVCFGDIVANM